MIIAKALLTISLLVGLSGCAIHDETMYIAGELVTIKFEDNRPKVRVSTGIEHCKWRGKAQIQSANYEVWMVCSIPWSM